MKKIFLFLFLIVVSLSSYSNTDKILTISQASEWKKLLHYRKGLFSEKAAFINADSFFIHKNGQFNAYDELIATIDLFKTKKNSYCEYPARYLLLSQELPDEFPMLDIQAACPKLNKWLDYQKVSSISLLFATGYFSNPASYYGHTLLKFNTGHGSDLLDNSLNYGAKVPPNENGLAYIIKGLFGGYDAKFTFSDYYHHNAIYSEIDLRDTWEYQLSLTQEEIDLIVYHAYEVLDQEFTYFFSSRNCVYNLAELLELAVDNELTHDSSLASIPVRLLFDLEKNKNLIADKKLRLSRRSEFFNKYQNLKEKKQFKILVSMGVKDFFEKEKTLSSTKKIHLLDTYLDYLRFLAAVDESESYNGKIREALSYRIRLVGDPYEPPQKSALAPTDAQKPTMIRLHASNDDAYSFQYRLTYYDYLSPDIDHPPFSQLKMGNLILSKSRGEKLYIRDFDFLHIENLNPTATGLKGDNKKSWRLKVSYQDSISHDPITTNSFYSEASYGRSKLFYDQLVTFLMLEGRVQLNQSQYVDSLAGYRAGIILKSPYVKASLVISDLKNITSSRGDISRIEFDSILWQRQTWDMRYSIRKDLDQSSEHTLSLGFFW